MDELLKILAADEKKIDMLTVRYNLLKKNIVNETNADTETRKDLAALISSMKKSNTVIVNHYLHENTLAASEIDHIVNTHAAI